MTPIPTKIRNELAQSGEMDKCICDNEDCSGRVEWEHAWIYAGKQIQEVWSIIPVCTYHHRGDGLDKDFNRYCSLLKAVTMFGSLLEVIKKYPKKPWQQEWKYLREKYERA